MRRKVTKSIIIAMSLMALAVVVAGLNIWNVSTIQTRLAEETVNTLKLVPPPIFTDIVQMSLKGAVHLQCPGWQGSGFVICPNMIVTARHCVEGVEDFLITTHNGHQLRATRSISSKDYDVGFIRIDNLTCVANERGTSAHSVVLQPLEMGNIESCVLGQSIYIIGSPYGKLNFNSLTTGIISGINRNWDMTDSWTGEKYGWEVAFTTDSAGHPGNSGCPLFTMDGKVRGILVGGFSPVLNCVMPCDLFLDDLPAIRLMFAQDKYQREVIKSVYDDPYYNEDEDNEYY